MTHVDLFTGICGFALAAKWVWGDEYENICFCDNNKFCQEVIKKNFGKESLIYGDIREVTRERVIADTKGRKSRQSSKQKRRKSTCRGNFKIDLLTGGFPCQPFSCAGKRRGTEDNRYLWPKMLYVIQDFKPKWVVAENVRGIINISDGLVFRQVCLDLEDNGYEIQTFIIPAVAVNAPHRRDRVWIVAHSVSNGHKERYQKARRKKRESKKGRMCESKGKDSIASNSKNNGMEGLRTNRKQIASGDGKETLSLCKDKRNATDTCDIKRWSKQKIKPCRETRIKVGKYRDFSNREWSKNWLEVATKLCGVDDGLPAELDKFKLSKAGHRTERLKALGNAIVPQIAVEIFKAIKEIEKNG